MAEGSTLTADSQLTCCSAKPAVMDSRIPAFHKQIDKNYGLRPSLGFTSGAFWQERPTSLEYAPFPFPASCVRKEYESKIFVQRAQTVLGMTEIRSHPVFLSVPNDCWEITKTAIQGGL